MTKMITEPVVLDDFDIHEMMLKDCRICGASGNLGSQVSRQVYGPVSKDNFVIAFCLNQKCNYSTKICFSLKEVISEWNK